MSLKLVAAAATGRILGAQGVGPAGVDKRIDVISTAIRGGLRAPDLADLETAYAPPFGAAKDPVAMLGLVADNVLSGLTPTLQWHELDAARSAGASLVDVRSAAEYARGHIAARLLLQHGREARNLDGGYRTWSAVRGAGMVGPEPGATGEV